MAPVAPLASDIMITQPPDEMPSPKFAQTPFLSVLDRGLEGYLTPLRPWRSSSLGGGSFSLTGTRPVVIGLTREGVTAFRLFPLF